MMVLPLLGGSPSSHLFKLAAIAPIGKRI
jgi:hypothetical protein